MSGRTPRQDAPAPEPDLQALARDWVTLWQSELAALSADREAQEAWRTMLALWAGAAGTMIKALPRGLPDGIGPHGVAAGGVGAAHAPRAAAAAAAFDARDAEIERLARLVGDLERRIAELERGKR